MLVQLTLALKEIALFEKNATQKKNTAQNRLGEWQTTCSLIEQMIQSFSMYLA